MVGLGSGIYTFFKASVAAIKNQEKDSEVLMYAVSGTHAFRRKSAECN